MTAVVCNRVVRDFSTADRPARRLGFAVVTALLTIAASACGTSSLATPDSTPTATEASSSAALSAPGSAIVVTVPDLMTADRTGSASQTAPPADAVPPGSSTAAALSSEPTSAVEQDAPAPAGEVDAGSEPRDPASTPGSTTSQPAAPAAPPDAGQAPAGPPAPPGDELNVSLANCDGCTVLATHRNVIGDLSAALVGTGSRAILLSVAADGAAAGVIGVPYGAAFAEPDGGVLACAESRCVVQGRQPDGRAILSAFELTGTGAWRDVSGDDAFPSATEQAAVVDIDGSLAIAVQDQADAAAVWLLYTWSGDRYVVVGCSADGSAPVAVDAVSPDQCLS